MEIEGAAELEETLQALLDSLSPASRRKLARHVARTLRKENAARVRSQVNPDGTPYADRRPDTYRPSFRKGEASRRRFMRQRLRRKFFPKLRNASHMRAEWSAEEASVGFANPTVARIASVHQFGLRDRVYRKGGLTADYPERKLLGLTADDSEAILDQVLRHMEM